TAGNQLCSGASNSSCAQGTVQLEVNPGLPAGFGFCHTVALVDITCSSANNFSLLPIDNTGHPLWDKICGFLGCKPAINVRVSDPSGGKVVSTPLGIDCGPACSPPGIDCGQKCTGLYESGTAV